MLGKKYLFVADLAGSGPYLVNKMFAAQNLMPNAQWVFGGNYLNALGNNILTVSLVNNYIDHWHAAALFGPQEAELIQFLNQDSNDWLEDGGRNTVAELLGGRMIDNVDDIRQLIAEQQVIQLLINHLKIIYYDQNLVFARNGVYLSPDFKQTPLPFAITATGLYWWQPGSHSFAYNQTGRMAVTSLDHPSKIQGYYFNEPNRLIKGPEDDRSFGIQYPNEPPRLILHRTRSYDQYSQLQLPVIYMIDSEKGLIGSI